MNAIVSQPVAPVHELLAGRASTRAYDGRPLERHDLLSLLEAARWAPSSYNRQPWRFLVWDRHADPVAFDKAFATLVSSNQKWVANVPVLIGVFADTEAEEGKINKSAPYDTGAAAFSLVLQAQALGLSARQIGGFDHEALRSTFDIPASVNIQSFIAVGHLGDVGNLAEDIKKRESAPRVRRELHEIAFAADWGTPLR
jgi:nitroreductase